MTLPTNTTTYFKNEIRAGVETMHRYNYQNGACKNLICNTEETYSLQSPNHQLPNENILPS